VSVKQVRKYTDSVIFLERSFFFLICQKHTGNKICFSLDLISETVLDVINI
jgi:hypothetical protein